MKRTIIFLLIVISSSILNGQVTQEWVARYNGYSFYNDQANAIDLDSEGNVYVTGYSYGTGTSYDYATIKYNSSGVQQWVRRFNGPRNERDEAVSIALDSAGNIYVTGFINEVPNCDIATIKYNSSGVQQWVSIYNGSANSIDQGKMIEVDRAGNIIVTGLSTETGSGFDYVTIKYSASGIQQWVAKFNSPDNDWDEPFCVKTDESGNVYVTGMSRRTSSDFDFATVKYNSSGVQQWAATYNGDGNSLDISRSIAVDGTGSVFVTGQTWGSGTSNDYATIKYNSAGTQQWVRVFNGTGNDQDRAYSITLYGADEIYVTGTSWGNGYQEDYLTIKYNSAGTQQWAARYNGPSDSSDIGFSITTDNSGNVYVTGCSWGTGSQLDFATIRYNSLGIQQWVTRYNGTGNYTDASKLVAVDLAGNVYATGFSIGSGTGEDFLTIKYSQQIGVNPISTEIPEKFTLYQNYPNPFNPVTKIKFAVPLSPLYERGDKGGFVTLKVYDVLGREVSTLVNEQLSPGTYEVEWDARAYPSGVYFYKLVASHPSTSSRLADGQAGQSFIQTRKMILIK